MNTSCFTFLGSCDILSCQLGKYFVRWPLSEAMDLSSSVTLSFNFFHDDPKRCKGGMYIQVFFPVYVASI